MAKFKSHKLNSWELSKTSTSAFMLIFVCPLKIHGLIKHQAQKVKIIPEYQLEIPNYNCWCHHTNLNNQMIFIKEIKIIHAFSMKKKLRKIYKSMINKLFMCGLRQVIFQAEIKSLVTCLFILIIPWQKSKEDPCLNLKPKFIILLILCILQHKPIHTTADFYPSTFAYSRLSPKIAFLYCLLK